MFLPGESHGQRSLVGYSPWGPKELDTTEWLTLSLFCHRTIVFGRIDRCWNRGRFSIGMGSYISWVSPENTEINSKEEAHRGWGRRRGAWMESAQAPQHPRAALPVRPPSPAQEPWDGKSGLHRAGKRPTALDADPKASRGPRGRGFSEQPRPSPAGSSSVSSPALCYRITASIIIITIIFHLIWDE